MSAFVTLEGVEGAGKSTLMAKLAERLRLLVDEVVLTREPGATPLGETLRGILLNPQNNINTIAELMLFAADRAQHISQVIKPALDRGALLFCDRYIHSTIAYQGYGRGLEVAKLEFLNNLVTNGLKPDLVLLLDLDPEVGLARAQARMKSTASLKQSKIALSGVVTDPESSVESDRFEGNDLEFHKLVRKGFLDLANDQSNNFVILDASRPVEKTVSEALEIIKGRFELNG